MLSLSLLLARKKKIKLITMEQQKKIENLEDIFLQFHLGFKIEGERFDR
jgi:hypothetical protein